MIILKNKWTTLSKIIFSFFKKSKLLHYYIFY